MIRPTANTGNAARQCAGALGGGKRSPSWCSSHNPVARTIGPCAPVSVDQALFANVAIVGTARTNSPNNSGHQYGSLTPGLAKTSEVIQVGTDCFGPVGSQLIKQDPNILHESPVAAGHH